MTRQQKYQLKMIDEGRCRVCGKPLFNKTYCYEHAVKARERQREKYRCKRRNKNAASYKRKICSNEIENGLWKNIRYNVVI